MAYLFVLFCIAAVIVTVLWKALKHSQQSGNWGKPLLQRRRPQ